MDNLESLYIPGIRIKTLNNLVEKYEKEGYENFIIEEIEEDYSCRGGVEHGKSYYLFGEKVDSKNKYFLKHTSYPTQQFNSKKDLFNYLYNWVEFYSEPIDEYSLFYGKSLESAWEIKLEKKITFNIGD
jgi:hypothetical protein